MFRVLTPIIRSSYNCNYSFWFWLTAMNKYATTNTIYVTLLYFLDLGLIYQYWTSVAILLPLEWNLFFHFKRLENLKCRVNVLNVTNPDVVLLYSHSKDYRCSYTSTTTRHTSGDAGDTRVCDVECRRSEPIELQYPIPSCHVVNRCQFLNSDFFF